MRIEKAFILEVDFLISINQLLTCDLSDVQKLKIELLKNFLYSPIQKKWQ